MTSLLRGFCVFVLALAAGPALWPGDGYGVGAAYAAGSDSSRFLPINRGVRPARLASSSRSAPLRHIETASLAPDGGRFLSIDASGRHYPGSARTPTRKIEPVKIERKQTTAKPSSPVKAEYSSKEPEELPFDTAIHHGWPLAGQTRQRISSPFGPRRDPFTGKKAMHEGLDIAAALGTPVLATAKGTVTGVGRHPRLGRYVRVDHADGTYSLYGHLQKATVEQGTEVAQGEKVGTVGMSGRATGPHLDYSLRKNTVPRDPLTVLTPPSRLRQEVKRLQLAAK